MADSPNITFECEANDGEARAGRIVTRRSVIETPVFMPVGTQGTVKGLRFEFLEDEYRDSDMHFDRDQIVRRMAEIMSININRAISHRGTARMRGFTARRSKAYHRNVQGVWRSLSQFLAKPFERWNITDLARVASMSRRVFTVCTRTSVSVSSRMSPSVNA